MTKIQIISDMEVGSVNEGRNSIAIVLTLSLLGFAGGAIYATLKLTHPIHDARA